ncbi:MAG TPA: His/Gly/Thr/Pro-type tRNA ligase C-terminal domain-containing protein, partial [Microbacterium sp.]|nr:His/Gly/Thr/Pro-type tRNA ligase C-terminal domain-containing protein [Microbacterium sp.]
YDDRPKVSPGVKFKDAELIGAPYILVVGRGLETGEVELKTRATGDSENLQLADAVAEIARRVADGLAG